MSIKVMSTVWEMDLPAKQKLVLLALADCANDEGLAWPSIATLARKCGCDERTVQRNLRDIEETGILTREEVLGRGCKYRFHPRQIATPGKKSPVTNRPKTPGKLPPKPSRTVICLSNDKHTRAKDWPEIPDWVPVENWNGFIAARKSKHGMPSPQSVKVMLGKLERWRKAGHDPGEVLDNATEGEWKGLWEPKRNPGGQTKGGSLVEIGERVRQAYGM